MEKYITLKLRIWYNIVKGNKMIPHAKIKAVAKRGPPKPSCRPTATASAVTVVEWDDGIPPDPISCLRSHRLSLYLHAS